MRKWLIGLAIVLGVVAVWVWRPAPVVDAQTIWVDAVRQGAMVREARGTGTLVAANRVELKIPESLAKSIQPGQGARVRVLGREIAGRVAGVASGVVEITLEETSPTTGHPADGVVHIDRLENVVYVGRPAVATPEGQVELFRLESGGKAARRVLVKLGRSSSKTIEVLEGLAPGDRVILSDMSAWSGHARIRLN